ncbi:MAG: lipopolysaccharide biosynthesis protein [Vicinamibacterales bacterium]
MADAPSEPGVLHERDAHDLKRRTVRGALASGTAQAATFVLRTGSMVVMARLLFPQDFGLFGMVIAFTGFLSLFRDFGLSMASVTRASVTGDQLSTLFWLNVGFGSLLALICAAAGPLLVRFYGEPRLLSIAIAVGVGFVFIGAGAQHRALLQRSMRFAAIAVIDTVALAIGIAAGIAMALLGQGYWALVAMAVAPQAATAVGAWVASGWIPGRPKRRSGVGSMLWYGGSVTFNGVIVYVAYNLDKVLLGRFFGAEALGIYGRAYQLINLPLDNLTSTVSQVAFPALSRLQNDPVRLRSYFLQGYSLFFALVLPITAGCALFSEDIVRVFLGPRWLEAATIFRLLSPTMLVFALINPSAWMLMATGRVARSVKMALVIAPTVILGYVVGLRSGPQGVALGFSAAMLLLAGPMVLWATHETPVSARDIVKAVSPALLSITAGAVAVFALGRYTQTVEPVFLRLVIESFVLFATYWLMLLFTFNQKASYMNILRELRFRTASAKQASEAGPDQLVEKASVSA